MSSSETTQSLVLFKPDSLKNSLTGYLLTMLSEFNTGLIMAGLKVVNVNKPLAEEHYIEHKDKSFFTTIIEYIMGMRHFPNEPKRRRVFAFVFEGNDAVKKIRNIAGPTDPLIARIQKPGCIRSLGAIIPVTDEFDSSINNCIDNLIHASSSESDAEREVKLWFKPNEIPTTLRAYPTSVSKSSFYYNKGSLSTSYSDGATCLVAPGDIVWASDLESLQAHIENKPAAVSLNAVAVKYCVNQ